MLLAGVACSIVPDVDVLGFAFGVPYGAPLGHRGLTHSLCFAFVLSGLVAFALRSRLQDRSFRSVWLYLFAATASHGLLDACTNGGLGVALLAPFSDARYFFPLRPIEVSPLSAARFLSDRGRVVLLSEALWVWLPSVLLAILVVGVRRHAASTREGRRSVDGEG